MDTDTMSSTTKYRVDHKLMRSLKIHLMRIDAPPLATAALSANIETPIEKVRISLTKMRSMKLNIKRLDIPSNSRVTLKDVCDAMEKEVVTEQPVRPDEDLPTKLYTCKVCGRTFKHRSSMYRHSRLHTSGAIAVEKPDLPDQTDSALEPPSNTSDPPPPTKLFSCPRCGEKFTNKADIIKHVQDHYDDIARIKMESCAPKNSYSDDTEPITSATEDFVVKEEPGIDAGPIFSNFNEFDEDTILIPKDAFPQSQAGGGGSGRAHACRYCPRVLTTLHSLRLHTVRFHPNHSSRYTKHNCGICGAAFDNKNKLKLHSRIHTGGNVFTCQFCESFFCSMWNLRNHVRKAHPEDAEAELIVSSCDVCGEEFQNMYKLKLHKRIHTGETLFPCKHCDLSFLGIRSRRCHVRRKHPEYYHDQVTSCEVCGIEFQNPYKLKLHSRVHTGEKVYACQVCPSVFSTSFVLRAHLKKRHPGSELSIYPCGECELKFENSYKLKLHSRVHEGGKIYNCDLCDAFYTNSYNLKSHMTSQHPDHKPEPKDEPSKAEQSSSSTHTCDACGKTFENRFKLKLHKRIHTDKSIFPCKVCHLGFGSSNSLRVHIKKLHPGHPWSIPRIPRPAIRKSGHMSAVRHPQLHNSHLHRRRILPPTGTRYSCKLCPSNYSQVYQLRAHMKKMHPDHGPTYFMWPCSVCGLEFQNRYKLKLHSRIHSSGAGSGNIFPCKLCASSFVGVHNLQSHMRNVHPDPNASATRRIHRMTTRQKFDSSAFLIPEKAHICRLCGSTFDFELRLNQHIRAEHSEHVTSCVDREESPPCQDSTAKCTPQVTSAIDEFVSLVDQYVCVNISINMKTEKVSRSYDSNGYPELNLETTDKSDHSNLANGDAEDEDDPLSIETLSSENSQAEFTCVNGNRDAIRACSSSSSALILDLSLD